VNPVVSAFRSIRHSDVEMVHMRPALKKKMMTENEADPMMAGGK
jgi:hypothetical protein